MTRQIRQLKEAVETADKILERATGLESFERRVVAYYCCSTYFIGQIDPFSILVIRGPTGTGKTITLSVCNKICNRPIMFSASRMTLPAFRDKLGEACNGTAIIDEADDANFDLEGTLALRYLRDTAYAFKKVLVDLQERAWETESIPIFGATVVHKREPFKDPAVEGRAIIIETYPVADRSFKRIEELQPLADQFCQIMESMSGAKLVKTVKQPKNIMPRILDSYRPVILMAKRANDTEFLKDLLAYMEGESSSFRDGQAYEPGPLLLQAILAHSEEQNRLMYSRPLKIEGQLVSWVRENHHKQLTPFQAAKILRGYGLSVYRSKGVNRIRITDIVQFVKLCRSVGLEDRLVEKEARRLGII